MTRNTSRGENDCSPFNASRTISWCTRYYAYYAFRTALTLFNLVICKKKKVHQRYIIYDHRAVGNAFEIVTVVS